MRPIAAWPLKVLLSAVVCGAGSAWAADDAALGLQLQEESPPRTTASGSLLRVFAEASYGRLGQRYDLPSEEARRASLDVHLEQRFAGSWKAVVSNRLDDIHPAEDGSRSTLNSLREAYLGWQSSDATWSMDLGRVNARFGPAYGFNPTDYFRAGSNRAVTSADPLAQRENRLGTVMLRAQRLWDGGALQVMLAPKLRDAPSQRSFSADFGATNNADQALVVVSAQPNQGPSLQGFVFHRRDLGTQLGASASALLGSATVVFAEGSYGRDLDLTRFDSRTPKTAHRAAFGLTYTTPSRLSVTAELDHNGFALNKQQWRTATDAGLDDALVAYHYETQRRQDVASRRAAMVYASQKDAGIKNLDVTALVRVNMDDRSRFWWTELRYHFPKLDLAMQWQLNQGKPWTEFGATAGTSLVQVLATLYF